ncbi:hypothetical protein Mal65_12630 [Crateriforma conspicua]|nr:hypothetical protein Mal65_12630 [Crateriforma conspicua]
MVTDRVTAELALIGRCRCRRAVAGCTFCFVSTEIDRIKAVSHGRTFADDPVGVNTDSIREDYH